MMNIDMRHPASFRDPAGFIFLRDGIVYRQINKKGADIYTQIMKSGLYNHLVAEGLLIPHEELMDLTPADPDLYFRVIRPELLPNISFPYEWCFSQYRDAALATLKIQSIALKYGMSLRDASCYNIQFRKGKPILIDTLSFEPYQPGKPWVAYQQFCRHFLGPLALMSKVDIHLNCLMRDFIDGIPLSMTAKMLPWRTRFSIPLYVHLHMHAHAQKRYADKPANRFSNKSFKPRALQGLLDSLRSGVRGLTWSPKRTQWTDYYSDTNYTDEAADSKSALTKRYIEYINPDTLWDFGGNTGHYARVAADLGIDTVCFDIDHGAVEKNYRMCKEEGRKNLLPLILDLTNPSPGIGWRCMERDSIIKRSPVDMVLLLAFVHHLAIGSNIPLQEIAAFLAQVTRHAVVEFVPRSDSQMQRLLSNKEDIFPMYTKQNFEDAFSYYFNIMHSEPITESERHLYLMLRKE